MNDNTKKSISIKEAYQAWLAMPMLNLLLGKDAPVLPGMPTIGEILGKKSESECAALRMGFAAGFTSALEHVETQVLKEIEALGTSREDLEATQPSASDSKH